MVSPGGKRCGFRAKGLHHALPRLLEGALLRRQRLLLALDRRLLVVLALPDLAQDTSLLALFLEALHGVLERLAFLDAHARHSPNHHLPAREGPRFTRRSPAKARQYMRRQGAVKPTRARQAANFTPTAAPNSVTDG